MSSSKRRWDQQGSPEPPSSSSAAANAAEDGNSKSASDAAAAAAAIAAKIAKQFASGGFDFGSGKEEPEFTHDIDINDVRNRYLLTKGATQDQIQQETGATVGTRGTWYPDRSKASAKDPPLYIHIAAKTKESLQNAVDKVNELIAMDMGSLVEKEKGRERRKWPEEKLPIGLESIRNFNVRAKVVGPSGSFVKYIQAETSTRVQIKGLGSGFIDQETSVEEPVPMYIHITGPDEGQVNRAKVLADDLLLVVRQEHGKVLTQVQQQQMELHQAQAQYAVYSAMGGYAPPPPSGPAPPPPPGGEGAPPPPPPGDAPPADPSAAQYAGGAQPPAPTDTEAYAAYWAAYGYDVNSAQFKEWQASQQQQYAQYYAAYAQTATTSGPAQPTEAPPPPPPPPS
ncbi:hypothetical protein EST38_g8904 [Candolleomyces aberdarensis]|uniref:K Homology domain-containing protein n=1 Tax=Candolleomyces aberdarensis TaxID=2316362 RepID=A0A4V1Q309_9AGAR|nr:hypothetical protein EST38_g8904 [Candolleomyces aberdarensis]